MNHQDDSRANSSDNRVIELYQRRSVEDPSSDLDKLIIAAAHREVELSAKNSERYSERSSFWNKLRIPVSFAGAAVMTLTLAHVMWPFIQSPDGTLHGVSPVNLSTEFSMEQARENQEKIIEEMAALRQAQSRNAASAVESRHLVKSDSFYEVPSEALGDEHTSVQKSNAVPEADDWAEEIVNLAKSGQFDEMNRQLKQFVEHYPDYPLLAKIRPYTR